MSAAGPVDVNYAKVYRCWRQSVPVLYDFVQIRGLEWPSLSVQWIPGHQSKNGAMDLVYGTHGAQSGGYVTRMEANLYQGRLFQQREAATEVFPVAAQEGAEVKRDANAQSRLSEAHYTEDMHRIRVHPFRHDLLAVKSMGREVQVLELDRDQSVKCSGRFVLQGHAEGGWGLEWNPHASAASQLLSSSDDGSICVWDVETRHTVFSQRVGRTAIKVLEFDPDQRWATSSNGCSKQDSSTGDVSWSYANANLFDTVDDTGRLTSWDIRAKEHMSVVRASAEPTNCVANAPLQEHTLATADETGSIRLWDTRKLEDLKPMHQVDTRMSNEEVLSVAWSPHYANVLATAGEDRCVHIWDFEKINKRQTKEEKQEGPPELMFVHGGHTHVVNEVAWCPSSDYPWMLASVAADNTLQLWEPMFALMPDRKPSTNKQPSPSPSPASAASAASPFDPDSDSSSSFSPSEAASSFVQSLRSAFSPYGERIGSLVFGKQTADMDTSP